MTIKISHKNVIYTIRKDNLFCILSKLSSKIIEESEIIDLMKKYELFDEYFLKTINKL